MVPCRGLGGAALLKGHHMTGLHLLLKVKSCISTSGLRSQKFLVRPGMEST
jgi:hypothetical protein